MKTGCNECFYYQQYKEKNPLDSYTKDDLKKLEANIHSLKILLQNKINEKRGLIV